MNQINRQNIKTGRKQKTDRIKLNRTKNIETDRQTIKQTKHPKQIDRLQTLMLTEDPIKYYNTYIL